MIESEFERCSSASTITCQKLTSLAQARPAGSNRRAAVVWPCGARVCDVGEDRERDEHHGTAGV